MSKPRKLSRPEIEELAGFFGCRIVALSVGSSAGVLTYDIYIAHGETKEKIGNIPTNNPIYMPGRTRIGPKPFNVSQG